MTLPENLFKVLEAIRDNGGSPHFVGGYVRDHVLGLSPKDFDVEVSYMTPTKLEEILSAFGVIDVVGQKFGVYKLHGIDADFSLPRKDNKTGAGHRDFAVTCDPNLNVYERCARRDLTMNSMEMNPFDGSIEDPFGGLKDIASGRMRATDATTFSEDDLRAVRVAQFVSRFPQFVPDDELVNLCSKADLSTLPGERLWPEFVKLLVKGSRPDMGMEFLKKANLLKFFPELQALVGCQQHEVYHAEGDTWIHSVMAVKVAAGLRNGDKAHDIPLMFGILTHDLGKPPTTVWSAEKQRIVSNGHDEAGVAPTKAFLKRLVAPDWVVDQVTIIVREHLKPFELVRSGAGASAYRRLVRRMGAVSLKLLVDIATADGEGRICYDKNHQTREDLNLFLTKASELGITNLQKPPDDIVRGKHLLDRGYAPGPIIGEILKKCREIQDETGETDADRILAEVLR